MKASGFPCPNCKSDVLADITGKDVVHILELKCRACGKEWAVESSYGKHRFMDAQGQTHA
jgi:transcription elongation factor Elf1